MTTESGHHRLSTSAPAIADTAPGEVRYQVLSPRAITVWAVLIVLIGVGVAVWLLLVYTDGNADVNRVQLEAIRTAGTTVVSTGGAAALLLAARRQRSTEIALKQKDRDQADSVRVAAITAADAEARRITELYIKAVDQLGSEKAPVRLGGLYALERLAQDHPEQRQTIVNVWCAYLRMPVDLPSSPPAGGAALPDVYVENGRTDTNVDHARREHRDRVQELEVRLTVQRLLADHLRPGPDNVILAMTYWPDIDLDLTGATLVNWNLRRCRVHNAMFRGARFTGDAIFTEVQFTGDTTFDKAQFAADAGFFAARFTGDTGFDKARFTAVALFEHAQFAREAWFGGAQFTRIATFNGAQFDGPAFFGNAQFNSRAGFSDAQFTSEASFGATQFNDGTSFNGAHFALGIPETIADFQPVSSVGDESTT